jgi:hypothetical protein
MIEALLLEEIIYLPLSLLRKSHREPLSRGQRDFYLQCIFLSGKEVQGYLCYPDWQVTPHGPSRFLLAGEASQCALDI